MRKLFFNQYQYPANRVSAAWINPIFLLLLNNAVCFMKMLCAEWLIPFPNTPYKNLYFFITGLIASSCKTSRQNRLKTCSLPWSTVHRGNCFVMFSPAFWTLDAPSNMTKSNNQQFKLHLIMKLKQILRLASS